MNEYEVTVRMVVTKTYVVKATNEDDAVEKVYHISTPNYEEGVPEEHDEEVVRVTKLT